MISYKTEHNGNTTKILAFDGDNQIGFGEILKVLDCADIIDIEVNANYRRRGIGREIFNRLLTDAQISGAETITLEVRISNIPAIKLYKNFGFVQISIRERYYGDDEDAIIMQLKSP